MTSLASYLVIGLIAAAATSGSMPFVIRIAKRQGWMATPDERRMHPVPTPDVGGIGMFIGILAGVVAASLLGDFDQLFQDSTEIIGVLVASAIIFGLGILDDIRDVSPPAKVTGIVVAAVALVWFGVTMFQFRLPFLDVFVLSDDWVPLITVLWLLGMTQAINLIDGLDGLAAGIVAIGAGAFFIYSLELTDGNLLPQPNVGPLVAIIAVGVCLGFLPFNFNPARIFMGDSGALLLGLLMAVATSVVGGRADPDTQSANGQTYFFLAPIFISLLVLAVPILDVLFAIVRRTASGRSFAQADMGHLHHRLIQLGHGPRRAVVILWGWAALLSTVVLFSALYSTGSALIVLVIVGSALSVFTVLHPRIRRDDAQVHESDLVGDEPHA
ncbi:MAG: undecaprenyl/decaprenyl-phosphate alpha-N-acetylglucosaminyl 1-phosphate transferase [Actinobacteria bacterium]|jgi:UDP-GlcNAc:undecaprenyl-phosphate/decaprenyl-phosphate GlcNAc-1-phosphate transferase|nr:undecaprenyl/decaprenyl-phosphate alpha-N-acetylglucosaminyl 1-phosphate transferase [Actinomycetota bacterium]NBX12476.1 undecaprenyl/decaprenyl-phosphate alpha-N-acetylglucosaminyl 1-phosphate transferase [Acidimicrobiia bacterium]NDE20046.1 undecaprenyl/decaprenyl-phosphate alpha-N-acetylglucosaminyl 1-phosphate transferase [Actinomycetota bacterium]NDF68119.1 undecaprenyl/decaprenyl-phosphate alpha-N-acetylglucosaminyl 1-phosphate transferase [Actinomycetota bacterium]NDG10695.1 undecapr